MAAGVGEWTAVALAGRRVRLEPLRIGHAEDLMPVLNDAPLHTFTGGMPADLEQLRARFARQVVGQSPDGTQGWLNWLVRGEHAEALGTVQATISVVDGEPVAEVAWVIGTAHQSRGYAQEAAAVMVTWLRQAGARTVIAHVHPEHGASNAVARVLGLGPTATVLDGEVRWQA